MPKDNLSGVFKHGNNFQLKEVNYCSSNKVKELKKVKQEQEAILTRKETDWHKLDNFVIKL
jgi:hypothetical protein